MDQIKMLRVRAIHNFLQKNSQSGLYILLGQYHNIMKNKFNLKNIKTSLFVLTESEYDELVESGGAITSEGISRWFK